MHFKLRLKRFKNHCSNNDRSSSKNAKNILMYYNKTVITTTIIISVIVFVMLIITLTNSTNDDAFNDTAEHQQLLEKDPATATMTYNDNDNDDIENMISATASNKNNSPTTLSKQQQQPNASADWWSVSVKLKGDGGHNGFYDKINTSNQHNEFNRFLSATPTTSAKPTPTKSASEKFFEDIELQESLSSSSTSSATSSNHRQLLPHRNKRYLVFPKGSSFQMIFDLIIGIVDYTSYAILGITCAVAWELPDKPPSELIEDVQLRLNEGTLGLRRNDTTQAQLKYVDKAIAASEGGDSKTTQQQLDDADYKAKMSATVANAEQYKSIATTPYYNNNIWAATLKKPSVTFNRPLPAYKAYHPYNNNNNNKNYYYAGKYDDSGKSVDSKTFLLQSSSSDTPAANGYAATHLNTHAADYYNNDNDMGTYNGVKSTSGSMNIVGAGGGYDRKNYADWNRKGSWYHDDSKYNKYATNKRRNWWKQNGERMKNAWQQKQQQSWSTKYEQSPQEQNAPRVIYNASPIYATYPRQAARTGRARHVLQKPPKHHIYPVFGKKRRRRRGHNDMTDFEQKMDSIHLKAHLQSRQLLFEKIEKLYKVRVGHNGTECVLRAICETAERQQQHQSESPQSFISELLRMIFSMPRDMHQQHRIETRSIVAGHFRDAHALAADCERRYALCKHSIWNDFEYDMKM